jgi:hypothetical protein
MSAPQGAAGAAAGEDKRKAFEMTKQVRLCANFSRQSL